MRVRRHHHADLQAGALVMVAAADDEQTLDRVKDVTAATWNASARRMAWLLPGSKRTDQSAHRLCSGADDMLWV